MNHPKPPPSRSIVMTPGAATPRFEAPRSSTWTLTVAAAQSTLTNCPNVPLSAVQVRCLNVSSGGIGSASGSCAGTFALSTTPTTVASGTDGAVIAFGSHAVSIAYDFTDQWKYPATSSSCTVSLNYSLTAQ